MSLIILKFIIKITDNLLMNSTLVPIATFALFILAASGCSTMNSTAEVVIDQDATVREGENSTAVPVPRGQSFALHEGKASLVEAPGYLPVLVIGPRAGTKRVSLNLKPLMHQDAQQDDFWEKVDSMLEHIQNVEALLRGKKAKQALVAADDLLQEFPKLVRLKYLKASCLIVLGEREAANALLKTIKEPPAREASDKKPVPEVVK